MRAIVWFLLALILGAFFLWLAVSFTSTERSFVALSRGGLLLLGLAAIAVGIMVRSYNDLVPLGLGLLLIGVLTFRACPFIEQHFGPAPRPHVSLVAPASDRGR